MQDDIPKEQWHVRKAIDIPTLVALVLLGLGATKAWYEVNATTTLNSVEIERTNADLAEFKSDFQTSQNDNRTKFTRLSADMTGLAVSNGRIEATTEIILRSMENFQENMNGQ